MKYLSRDVLVLSAMLATVAVAGCSSPAVESDPESAVAPAPAPEIAAAREAEAEAAKAAATAAAAAAAAAAEMPSENPIATSEASIRAGRGVYAKICRACHGLQGEGDGVSAPPGSMPANLVDDEWVHGETDPEIFMTIKYGLEPYDVMEPWGRRIADEDIWHTINFLRDLAE